jgi:hypothetical protein
VDQGSGRLFPSWLAKADASHSGLICARSIQCFDIIKSRQPESRLPLGFQYLSGHQGFGQFLNARLASCDTHPRQFLRIGIVWTAPPPIMTLTLSRANRPS